MATVDQQAMPAISDLALLEFVGHTAGPWEWRHNDLGKRTVLVTPDRGRLIVMDIARAGMQGAEPRFARWQGVDQHQPRGRQGGILKPGTDHVDARLIAAAPLLLAEVLRLRALLPEQSW